MLAHYFVVILHSNDLRLWNKIVISHMHDNLHATRSFQVHYHNSNSNVYSLVY